ncbi:tryptophan halogenase family protein [Yoonia sp. 2307UL14-13]|uniref:tryptophan halogenase family protein n=1 Tax=Yoonia sp. 2307UL14-13 TaxID=3126506 RepID=UPI0030A088E2
MGSDQKHIAIVGGGTAGWLAALMLQKAATGPDAPRISVIESPNIPTVGVGEGSTSVFRQILLDLGIDEMEFLRETGATLKFGIKHAGWRKDGKDYFGPIDDPNALASAPAGLPTNWLHHAQIAAGKKVADLHLFTRLMRGSKSAYARKGDQLVPLSPFHHAYHFDQARLGRFLASRATGIDHIKTEVNAITRDTDSGHITALECSDARTIPVDFVIDCTGFRRAIVGQMGSDWVSYANMLPLNKAMPFWLDHDPKADIAPFTLAQALGSGWMWGIPVQDRIGCGYVFSDAHITPEQAQAEVETKLRRPVEIRRVIDINPGRLRDAWIGNCVAVGLAQSFLEPLEATSIHGTLVQMLLLLRQTPEHLVSGIKPSVVADYNGTVARQVDEFAQFINLHYAGGRTDTPFWKDMTNAGVPPAQRDRIEHWQGTAIMRADFHMLPQALPHVEEQLYTPVLDGLGLLPKAPSKQLLASAEDKKSARAALKQLQTDFAAAARVAVKHHAFLR